MSSKLPFYKIYPGDEKRSGIRQCSLKAEGLYKRLRDEAHDTERRAYLSKNGKPMSLESIAKHCDITLEDLAETMTELVSVKLVLCARDGTYFVPSLVKEEQLRLKSKRNGKLGGNPKLRIKGLTHGLTPGVKPHDNETETAVAFKAVVGVVSKEKNVSTSVVVPELLKGLSLYESDVNFCKNLPLVLPRLQKDFPGLDIGGTIRSMHTAELEGKYAYSRRCGALENWLKNAKGRQIPPKEIKNVEPPTDAARDFLARERAIKKAP